MITNREDAIWEMERDRYLYVYSDGRIVSHFGVAFSKEAFEILKTEGWIVLVSDDGKIAVYENKPGFGGAEHYHLHD